MGGLISNKDLICIAHLSAPFPPTLQSGMGSVVLRVSLPLTVMIPNKPPPTGLYIA